MALRVLLVDDHAGFRDQARKLLEAEGLVVVGEATSGAQALDLLLERPVDVVLLDVVLPGRDGIDVADEIATLARPPAVILTSSRSATDFGERLVLAPVRGFLPKAELSAAAIDRLLRDREAPSPGSPETGDAAAPSLPVGAGPPRPPATTGTPRVETAQRPLGPTWLRLVTWPATVLVGLFTVWALLHSPLLPTGSIEDEAVDGRQVILAVTLVGGSTALAGLAAWWRRPDRFAGPLLVAVAWAWFLGAVSWAIGGGAFQGYYVLLVAGLVIAYPSGRLGAAGGMILSGMLAVVLASTLGRVYLGAGTAGFAANCYPPEPLCAPAPMALVTAARAGFGTGPANLGLYDTLDLWFQLAVLAGTLLAVAVVARRWVLATGPWRRVLTPPLAMGIALATAVAVAIVQRQSSVSSPIPDALGAGVVIALAAMPHAFTWDLVRGRLARAKVADLVVSLGADPGPEGMRGALSRALSDRSVSVLVWSGEAGGYFDETGTPADLPNAGAGRSYTVLERQGQPLGAIVYDAALREDPALLESVAAAAATAIENDRLQAEVEAQLAEVQASRARIVAAGDQQRERLERDLHDGAQQELVALAIELRSARLQVDPTEQPGLAEALAHASARAEAAVGELRELARGIHPVVLTEAGLLAGIESLARRATIPVTVDADLPPGLPAAVDTTAYFLVSEALANVAKHAGADGARVHASVVGDVLRIEIADDGIGGADPARGTGLRGLGDRVAAVGGSLSVESPEGGGTRLVAEIPCAS